jgi:hypothetical protein
MIVVRKVHTTRNGATNIADTETTVVTVYRSNPKRLIWLRGCPNFQPTGGMYPVRSIRTWIAR